MRSCRLYSLLAAAGLLALAKGLAADAPPGPVGVRVVLRSDARRPLPGGAPRPLQIVIWYPAAGISPLSPLNFSSYVELQAEERGKPPSLEAARRAVVNGFRLKMQSAGVPIDDVVRMLDTVVLGHLDAPHEEGMHPVVLLALDDGDSPFQVAFLAETLASHGWVAVTMPSPTRLGGLVAGEVQGAAKAAEQAGDLALALGTVADFREADITRLGIVADGFGARGALVFAATEPKALALVSLDGELDSGAAKEAVGKARLALLHLHEKGPSGSEDLAFRESPAPAPRWSGLVKGLRHVHFTSAGFFAGVIPSVARATNAPPNEPQAFAEVFQALLSFLDTIARPGPAASGPSPAWHPPALKQIMIRKLDPSKR